MTLAIFDLDNTLIGGDSDHLWGDYLVARGIIDAGDYKARNDQFYQDYLNGSLDQMAYLRFAMAVLTQHPLEQLHQWRAEFMRDELSKILLPKASALLQWHREQGHFLLIITATNDFVTAPIAELLGVDHMLATESELRDGRYTGEIVGVPCFQDGKIHNLNAWLATTDHTLDGAWFYSDSRNDLPLLEVVDHPVAVDPDDHLRAVANERGWSVISLRD
ncbi:HAD family hydrolase [Isoalcanivorax beigongshangi]|uniref:HAD family hydrolase n=1 Tax=Isoalcanivorax beigongshangi TaxID=3238810 RepID=A0ABV4AJS9_9GAMM